MEECCGQSEMSEAWKSFDGKWTLSQMNLSIDTDREWFASPPEYPTQVNFKFEQAKL